MYSEYGTAGEPGAVGGIGGYWRVEGGLKGARSPFSWLGVACASRYKGIMNGLCPTFSCGAGYKMYESIRVVWVCKKMTKVKFTERAEQPEHQHCRAGKRGPR